MKDYPKTQIKEQRFIAVLHFTVTTRYYGLMAIIIFLTGQGSITLNLHMMNQFKFVNLFSMEANYNAKKTRCCTLRRAKNTHTRSFVSRTVNRK